MAEIQFADGKRVVDDIYVGPINEATNNQPQRFTFQSVMDRLGPAFEKQYLRKVQRDVIGRHFRTWGS